MTALAYCTVVGKFNRLDTGSPPVATALIGQVTLTPNLPGGKLLLLTETPPRSVVVDPLVVALDSTGSITTQVPATDQTGVTSPAEFTYTASFQVQGETIASFAFAAPSGGTVDLTTVAPVPVAAGVSVLSLQQIPDLSGTYAPLAAPHTYTSAATETHRGRVIIRADDNPLPSTVGVIQKPHGDGTVAPMWFIHDDANGYLIHMVSGPNFGSGYNGTDGLALIGMNNNAADSGSQCILIDNHGVGTTGLMITNFPTAGGSAYYGFQQSKIGLASTHTVLAENVTGGSPLLGLTYNGGGSTPGQQLFWMKDAGAIGFAGEFRGDTGELNWYRDIRTKGFKFSALPAIGDTNISKVSLAAQPYGNPAFRDGVITATSTSLVSATAKFTNADTGRNIWGGGIAAGTTLTYVDATHVTLSIAATTTSSACEFYINRAPGQYTPGMYWYADDGSAATAYATQLVAGPASPALQLKAASVNTSPGNETFDVTYFTAYHIGATAYMSFFGAGVTPQAARAGQLTDSTGGTVSATLAAGITDAVAKNAIASLAAKVNALELMMHNIGISA